MIFKKNAYDVYTLRIKVNLFLHKFNDRLYFLLSIKWVRNRAS